MAGAADDKAVPVARIALVGTVLGALLGSGASAAGAYFVSQSQNEAEAESARQTAYVEFAGAVQRYRMTLSLARDAIWTGDQGAYSEARAQLFEQDSTLYEKGITVDLSSESDVTAVRDVLSVLFAPRRLASVEDCDVAEFDAAVRKVSEPLNQVLAAAEDDLDR